MCLLALQGVRAVRTMVGHTYTFGMLVLHVLTCVIAADSTPLTHTSVHGLAGAVGVGVVLLAMVLVPIVTRVAAPLAEERQEKVGTTSTYGACALGDARRGSNALRSSTAATCVHHNLDGEFALSSPSLANVPASLAVKQEPIHSDEDQRLQASEKRLLRALGYDELQAAEAEDGNGTSFLSQDEIAAFRERSSSAESLRVRYKDRADSTPLSDIVTRWQAQTQAPQAAEGPKPPAPFGGCAKEDGTKDGGTKLRRKASRRKAAVGTPGSASALPRPSRRVHRA